MGAEAALLCAAPRIPRASEINRFCRARIPRDCARRVLNEQQGSTISNSSGIIVWLDAFAALKFTLSVQRMK